MQAQLGFLGRTHDGYVNLGVLQDAGHLRPRHGHVLATGIAQFKHDGLAGDFADHFRHAGQPVSFHENAWRGLQGFVTDLFYTSSSWDTNSATGWLRRASTIRVRLARTVWASAATMAIPR